MLRKLKAGHICHAMYDSVKLESWIEDDHLYFRAYIHHPPSVEFLIRRIDTLYKYLILSFQEKVKYPLHSIIV